MKKPDTSKSDEIVERFLERNTPFKRKEQVFEKHFNASPKQVFKQLCPAREADWINGWTVDLIYTTTGYAEPLCVFQTPASNILGSGLWILTKLEPNKVLEGVIFQTENGIIEYLKIELIEMGNNACKGIWTIILTATNENGNSVIASISDEEPDFLRELAYFLEHGKLMEKKSA
ncbi:hypothetical protein FKG94_13240 [Exilibacterium tricleocarpae]|uniref:Uncharacterized protein n=1 Tax=Exilibacterium tricleocarpae TaxID=2591008 RepID=A0A545TLD6_9GAMM|nr:hypothetical protein [Exilibacterium tricleocarpae]TQV78042.1 hypothetical protein FKG94_13240 [Exilibacterium tricleocarpae]